jgi:hypothetical protein
VLYEYCSDFQRPFALTSKASSPAADPFAKYGPGVWLTESQLPFSEAKYMVVSDYVVSEETVDGQTQQAVHHLSDAKSVKLMQRRLSLMVSGPLEVLGSSPSDELCPNAESWSRIFEQTSGDHSSSDDDLLTPIQRYRLSFTSVCPGPAFEGMITRWTAAERAARKAPAAKHSTLWIVEDNGYIREDNTEKRSVPLQTKYEWRRATSQELESLRSCWESREVVMTDDQ